MTCGRARRLLWPDGGPRAVTAEIVAAREHAGGCAGCRQFLEDMRRLAGNIRQAVPRPEAPVEVRDRLFKAIARARIDGAPGATSRRRRLWAGIAAAVLLAGGTWAGLSTVSGRGHLPPDPLRAIVEDHLRAQRQTGLASSDSLELALWLAERVPFRVAIPLFPEARMTGARLLLANGQSAAVVDYLIGGRPLSYYVVPVSRATASDSVGGVRVTSRTGYRIAAWEDGGLTHALVAGLPATKLVELAHYCIEQTTGRQQLSSAESRGRPIRRRAGVPPGGAVPG